MQQQSPVISQKSMLTNIVKTKIEFVKSQVDELHELLNIFIKKETATATVIVDSEKPDLTKVREINSRLDTVLDFLLEKCSEIDKSTTGSVPDYQRQQLKISDPASDTFSRSFDIPKLFDRVEAVELSVSTASQRVSELGQIRDVNEAKVQIIEEKLENLISQITKDNVHYSGSAGYVKKKKYETQGSVQTKKLENIEDKIRHMVASNCELSEEIKSRTITMHSLIKRVESECFEIKNSLQKKDKEAADLKRTSEDLTLQLNTLTNQYNQVMVSLDSLSSKMDTSELDGTSVESRMNEEDGVLELQERVRAVEESRRQDLESYEGKLSEVDCLYKQVCQMVASKVQPLHRLQDILIKYHQTIELQEETALQTTSATTDVSDTSLGAGVLGPKGRRPPIGFTSYWGDHAHISANTTLIFTDVLCNEGNCYNSTNGSFTAPYNGLYLALLTLRQRDEGKVNAHIRMSRYRHFVVSSTRTVCKSFTGTGSACCSDTGVVYMKAGDTLFVAVMEVELKPRLSFYSSFSCVFIG